LTLEEIVKQGIPLEQLENALHQMEFYRSEINGDSGPFGLSLFMRSALLKQHGANPEEGLKIHMLAEELRKSNLADPYYFTNLIRYYLLDNSHTVQVIMRPDINLAAEERAEERERLDQLQNSLTPEDVEVLVDQAAMLTAFQALQEEEDLDVLPKMSLEDVPKMSRDFELTREKFGALEVFHHNTFTNGIIYADLVYDLPEIAEEDLPFVRLFSILMPQMGSVDRNYSENLEYIQAHTGGVGASMTFNLNAVDYNQFKPSFYIRGKALHRKASKLFEIIKDMVLYIDFQDLHRLREVIMKHFTALQSSLHQNALRYAVNLSASCLDVPSKIANEWYGLSYYWKIKKLAENFDREGPALQAKLLQIHEKLLCLENPNLVITCDSEMYNEFKTHRFYGLAELPTKAFKPWTGIYPLTPINPQGRIISSPVAFTAKVLKTVSYSHPDAPALNIAAFLCDNLVLHAKVREQGGAYGGGAVCNSMAANFYFYAYRDPNLSSTLQAFKEAIDEIASGNFDEEDLNAAKLEMIQALDLPVSPGSRGDLAYGWLREGKPQVRRQKFRNAILSLTPEDVTAAVKSHLQPYFDTGITVSFANQELLDKENIILAALNEPFLQLEKI
ncbi:MAG: insulinase family protein, partial [Parachlamydiaceae bacterium]|nr:insulinase family protein [Parachlamydiaceae bacterium]